MRPPLVPVIIGILSFFGWRVAEIIFIVLVSFLFFYSIRKLANALNFNETLLYSISLTSYTLLYGLINGTELISVALLTLALSLIIQNNPLSGFFLGLSTLSRYTALALFPILFFSGKIKNITKSFLFFALTLTPWFIYNYFKFGNFFTSIADQYANNILFRSYLFQVPQISHILAPLSILLPFLIIGLILSASKIKQKKIELIMFFLFFYTIYVYCKTPVKHPRYLFTIILPVAYFSYLGIAFIINKIYCHKKNTKITKNKTLAILGTILFLFHLIASFYILINFEANKSNIYNQAIDTLNKKNISNCQTMSNSWIYLNYLGKTATFAPGHKLVNKSLEQGYKLILFKNNPEPDYTLNKSFLQSFPIIEENNNFIILSSKMCVKNNLTYDKTYLKQVDENTFQTQGWHINENPCFIIFHKFALFEKICNLINFNGFKKDELRNLG